ASLAKFHLWSHETDLIDSGRVRDVDSARNHLEIEIGIAFDKCNFFSAELEDIDQPAFEAVPIGVVFVDFDLTGLVDNDDDGMIIRLLRRVRRWRLRRKRIEAMRNDRRNRHEDNQQNEQNIDHGRHVDIALGSAAGPTYCHSHTSSSFKIPIPSSSAGPGAWRAEPARAGGENSSTSFGLLRSYPGRRANRADRCQPNADYPQHLQPCRTWPAHRRAGRLSCRHGSASDRGL